MIVNIKYDTLDPGRSIMNNKLFLTFTSYAFFFLTGYFINIGGAVTGTIAATLFTGTATVGYCFSVFMIGRFVGITGNGILIKKPSIDKKYYLRAAPAILFVSVAGLSLTDSIVMLAISLFVAGVGIGILYSSSNMILVEIYDGKQKAFHITMMNFLYSVGGVTSPIIAGNFIASGFSWSAPYFLFAGLLFIVLALALPTNYRAAFAEKKDASRDSGTMNARLWLVCASIVLYILAEFSITFWTPVYMREALGKDPLFAGATVSTFWIAVLIGRFLAGLASRHIRPRTYVLCSGSLAVFSVLALSALSSERAILVACFAVGLSLSGLFPFIFTLGTNMSESLKRTFPTFMMLSAATGSFLAMPAGSVIKNLFGVERVLLIPALALALMCAFIVMSAGRIGRKDLVETR
jgi:TsgA-like MFS transporter